MNCRFDNWSWPDVVDGKPTIYHWIVRHTHQFSLGYKTDIGAFTYINAKNGVIIEDYVQIGSHCSLFSISTIDKKQGSIQLKKGCRIGTHSVIMPGVTIGERSIIGAFSFVNSDIPDNVLAFGVPAQVIRTLSDEERNYNLEEPD